MDNFARARVNKSKFDVLAIDDHGGRGDRPASLKVFANPQVKASTVDTHAKRWVRW
jgi:hypothetical protein